MLLELLFWMVVVHFIADFPLQSDFIAMNKGKRWYIMFVHCVIWAGLLCLVLKLFGLFSIGYFIWFFVGHYICDTWKAKQVNGPWHLLYIDQAFHMLQMIAVCLFI